MKERREYEYSSHGIKLQEYVNNPEISTWIKVLTYIIQWYLYPPHKGKVFFQKYSTIVKFFGKCGFKTNERMIEEAFWILKTPENKGGVNLIKCVYADTSKSDWTNSGENPKKWVYRKVYLNWKRIHRYFSIFTTEGKDFKNLPPKSRLKKLVRCRSLSYTKELQTQFELAMKEAKIERYNSARKMFYGFLYTVSRNFYDVTKLIKNYIPDHTIDIQKEQDEEVWIQIADTRLRGSPMDPFRKDERIIPPVFKQFYEAL